MYAKSDVGSQYFGLDKSLDRYQFNLGYYFNDASEVSIYYTNNSGSDSKTQSNQAVVNENDYLYKVAFDYDAKTYGVKARSFISMESFTGIELTGAWQYTQADDKDNFYHYLGEEQALALSQYVIDSNVHFINIAADFYLTKSWSVGGQYSWSKRDIIASTPKTLDGINYQNRIDDSDSTYIINTAYWWQFSDSFAATASVAKPFNDDGDSPDGVFFRLGVNARF